jgi:hypothetical protein
MEYKDFDFYEEDYKPLQEGDLMLGADGVRYIVISSSGNEVVMKKMCNPVYVIYNNLQ